MSDHDPLCQWANTPTHRDRADSCPRCYLIARVRADERERIAQAIEGLAKAADIRWRNEQHVYWEGARDAHRDAARIARNGGGVG